MTVNKENLANAMADNFQFTIINNEQQTKKVAIFPTYLERLGLDLEIQNGQIQKQELHYHNTAALVNAGFNVDTILDDAILGNGAETFEMKSSDSKFSIRNFLAYAMKNQLVIKRMSIMGDSISSLSTKMFFSEVSAFAQHMSKSIDLKSFLDKGQFIDRMIDISFTDKPLTITPELFASIDVLAKTTLNITIYF